MGKQKFRQNTSLSPFSSLASLLTFCIPPSCYLLSLLSHRLFSVPLVRWWVVKDEVPGYKSFFLLCSVLIPLPSAASPFLFPAHYFESSMDFSPSGVVPALVWVTTGHRLLLCLTCSVTCSYLLCHLLLLALSPPTALAFLFLFCSQDFPLS